jgi:nicotinate-nucleotide adenylyltransferase
MSDRIGLYGGSFDPIHNGHLIIARAVAASLRLDRVILLPSAYPPNKPARRLAPANHRREMVRLAIDGDPLFEQSDFDLNRPGPSYTVDTVAHFRDQFGPDAALFWIIGADSLAELTTWRNLPRILDLCDIVTAARSTAVPADWDRLRELLGEARTDRLRSHVLDTPIMAVSSTDIRRRVAAGLSIGDLVPEAVACYITQNTFYREP